MLDIYTTSGIRIAISEYANPFVLEMAKKYDLQVNHMKIGQSALMTNEARRNGKTEILLTNYETKQLRISNYKLGF
jgi:hypothetical protein